MFALKKVTPPTPITSEDSKTLQAHRREVVECLIELKRESAETVSILGKMLDVVNGSFAQVK